MTKTNILHECTICQIVVCFALESSDENRKWVKGITRSDKYFALSHVQNRHTMIDMMFLFVALYCT